MPLPIHKLSLCSLQHLSSRTQKQHDQSRVLRAGGSAREQPSRGLASSRPAGLLGARQTRVIPKVLSVLKIWIIFLGDRRGPEVFPLQMEVNKSSGWREQTVNLSGILQHEQPPPTPLHLPRPVSEPLTALQQIQESPLFHLELNQSISTFAGPIRTQCS